MIEEPHGKSIQLFVFNDQVDEIYFVVVEVQLTYNIILVFDVQYNDSMFVLLNDHHNV